MRNMEEGCEASREHRSITIDAYGDNVDELELDALDKARAFFGPGPQLRVAPNYRVCRPYTRGGGHPESRGKSWYARVSVEVVEQA